MNDGYIVYTSPKSPDSNLPLLCHVTYSPFIGIRGVASRDSGEFPEMRIPSRRLQNHTE